MMGKILFLAGAATGYVLGSKAGRQAYDQIKGKAQDLWGDPHVQKAVSQAGQVAKDAATVAQSKISGAAKEAKSGDGSDDVINVTVTTPSDSDAHESTPPVPPAVPTNTFSSPGTAGTGSSL